ncbi:MAG: alkaline phosphatase family protein [Planctomycetes bacterium]|nr:alkaline phosphatase family protein [Planctomycetota bacterium]
MYHSKPTRVSAAFAFVFCSPLLYQTPAAASNPASAPRPRLVVICVFDQMREEYLDRFKPLFGDGGFNRILREGVRYANCDYPYAATETAPGHATIGSGRLPRNHGIIANEWYGSRKSQSGREFTGRMYSVEDPQFAFKIVNIEGAEETVAPAHRNFHGENFSDRVKAEIPGSKVYSVSQKDRSALSLGGAHADGVFWFQMQPIDPNSPVLNSFVSSTNYYKNSTPAWIGDFMKNEIKNIPNSWESSVPPAIAANRAICTEDNAIWEGGPRLRHQFPFPTRVNGSVNWEVVWVSSIQLVILADFAKEWIDREKLGADDAPDVLWISFSATDSAGHCFGPDSLELCDIYKNADAQLDGLLKKLDAAVPEGKYVVGITSDHGVCTIPEDRFDGHEGGGHFLLGDSSKRTEIEKEFASLMKIPEAAKKNHVARVMDSGWYLNRDLLKQENLDYEAAASTLKIIILKQEGVLAAYTRAELQNEALRTKDPIARSFFNCYDPARSGDVMVALKPWWIPLGPGGDMAATHGSPHRYDTHVPMLLFGCGIARGKEVADPVTPLDLVPTLASLLHINPPKDCDGRILPGAFAAGR